MNETQTTTPAETKFCKECGQKIAKKAVICPHCGCQIEETAQAATPQIVINNSNQNQNTNQNLNGVLPIGARLKSKWISLLLCICLGFFGGHKFYEGKIMSGVLYCCTLGLFGVGVIIDFFSLLNKPNPYYVF